MDEFYRWLANYLPRRLVRFGAIRIWMEATTGPWSDTLIPNVTMHECLRRWEGRAEKPTAVLTETEV